MRVPYQPNITFAMIKTDAFANKVDREILETIRANGGIILHSIRQHYLTAGGINRFYCEHVGRPYYPDLEKSVSGLVMPMILEFPNTSRDAYTVFRDLIGATNARNADPNTIRGMFGGHRYDPEAPLAVNAIHGSDSLRSVRREIGIMFGEKFDKIHSHQYGDFYLNDLVYLDTTT